MRSSKMVVVCIACCLMPELMLPDAVARGEVGRQLKSSLRGGALGTRTPCSKLDPISLSRDHCTDLS